MQGVQDYLSLIAGHGPFLLLLLPVVGALLVAVSSPLGTDVVRRTAFTNVVLSVAIALLMLLQFRVVSPSERQSGLRFQMAGEAMLESGIGTVSDNSDPTSEADSSRGNALVRIAVGVDGVSLWFVVLIPLVMIPAVREVPALPHAGGFLVLLLLMEACLIGVFAATDVLFFAICLEAAGLLLFALIGRYGAPDHRRDLSSLAIAQFVAGLLVLFGLTVLVLTHWQLAADGSAATESLQFSLSQIANALPPNVREESPADSLWRLAEPVIFWSLTIGLMARSALFPFHGRFCENSGPWPVSIGILAYGIVPCVATFGFVRWVLPVCPTVAKSATAILVPISLCGAIVCALLALKQTELKRIVAYASVSHAGLAFAAVATLSPGGLAGGVMDSLGHAAAFAMLAIAVGQRNPSRWTAALVMLATITICGLPILSGFPSHWVTLVGFRGVGESTGVSAVAMAAAVTVMLAWALLRAGVREWVSSDSESDPSANDDRPRSVLADIAILVAMLLAVGVVPQFVLDRLTPALRAIAPQSFAPQTTDAEAGP